MASNGSKREVEQGSSNPDHQVDDQPRLEKRFDSSPPGDEKHVDKDMSDPIEAVSDECTLITGVSDLAVDEVHHI
jgi:hypothetical protein